MVLQHRSRQTCLHLITLIVTLRLSLVWGTDNGLGPWGHFTECSRTCGGGIRQRSRPCLHARPEYCRGKSIEYQSCNAQECPLGSIDFRTLQCISHITEAAVVTNSTWLPFIDHDAPCKLYCRNQQGVTRNFHKIVVDGTHCDNGEQFGLCINGICQLVGCDHLLGSVKAEDKCLVCGGDGESCHTETGSSLGQTLEFNKKTKIATFPFGASKVVINLHSLSSSPGNIELTSGGRKILKLSEVFRDIRNRNSIGFACTQFHYSITVNGFKFTARGPLNDTLHLMFINNVKSKKQGPYIDFEFSVPKSELLQRDEHQRYAWIFGSWTPCSEKCGTGYQLRAVSCIDQQTGRASSPQLCSQYETPVRNQTCTEKACDTLPADEYKWIEGHWGECIMDCGPGEQTQIMHCVKTTTSGNSEYVVDDVCLRYVGAQPVVKRACYGEADDCPYWATGSWSECSVSCGLGSQTRNIYCQKDPADDTQDPVVLNESQCPHGNKPQQMQNCSLHDCNGDTDITIKLHEQTEEDGESINDCKTSVYGCCPDDITPAMGSNNFGCSHEVTAGALCEQPKDAGTCPDYILHWYFDVSSGTCRQFWYGGCGGNSNRFSSQEECEDNCVKGKRSGPHTKSATSKGCTDSKYGCCPDKQTAAEGPNYEGCKENCKGSEYGCCADGVTPVEGPDQEGCEISSGNLPCEHTAYGCCADGITAASGPSFSGCNDLPDSEKRQSVPKAIQNAHRKEKKCTATWTRDVCTEYTIKWRFDVQKQQCDRQWWGGCADNGNVFESQEECNAECKNTEVVLAPASEVKTTPASDVKTTPASEVITTPASQVVTMPTSLAQGRCTAVATRTLCTEYTAKWRFDSQRQECVRHWWGGCEDNGNVFDSQAKCEAVCMNTLVITNPDSVDQDFVNICDMPADTGHCKGNILRYYYDSRDRTCKKFYYGGCQGNENNFVEIEDCQRECMQGVEISHFRTTTTGPIQETLIFQAVTAESTVLRDRAAVCLMAAAPGSCNAEIKRWYYDHLSGTCLHFQYSGCGGSKNNFETLEECNDFCNDKEVCLQSLEIGSCRAAIPRFFFNSQTRSCQSFLYGGCQGNLNNFATKEACDKKCYHYKHSGSPVDVLITDTDDEVDVCQLKVEKGSCRGYNIMWYYSTDRNRCERFIYTGCGGNNNQFNSEQECSDRCLKVESTDGRDSLKQTSPHVQTTESIFHYPTSHGLSTVRPQKETRGDHQLILVKLGDTAELTCRLRSHGILWYRDGFLMTSSSRLQVYNNGTLVLRSVTEDMSGIYTCRIYNGYNSHHSEKFMVEVYVPPKIVPGPAVISIKPGDTTFVHCQAIGSPEPVISWKRHGHLLQTNNHYSVFANGTLAIRHVLINDTGDYECSAENGMAEVKKHIHLKMKETIDADIQRHKGMFTEGDTIQLHCKGSGYPRPQLEWIRDGQVLKSDGKVLVADGNLTITSLTIEDAGMYKCIAFNDKGKAEDVTAVQIKLQDPLEKCEDTMRRTNCHLIVTGRLCGFRMFTKKCCHSCRKAGFL